MKIILKDKGPCDRCLVQTTCKDICQEAWDFHLGQIAKGKRSWTEELAPIWDKRL